MWRSLAFAALLATTFAFNLPGIPRDFTANDAVLAAISDDVARKFEIEYLKYLKTGKESPVLKQISTQLAKSHSKKDLFIKEIHELGPVDEFFTCVTCRAVVNVIVKTFRDEDGELNGANNKQVVKKIVLDICQRLNLQTEEVCSEMFESHWPTTEYIIMNSEQDSRFFCGLFMQWSYCSLNNHTEYEWTLNIDNSAENITGSKSDFPGKTSNDLNILHLTDIHHDPLYVPGSLAECDEPLCCQRHKEQTEGTSKAAGYWGDYRECDLPWQTIESAFNHIKENHKIDFIYQTGDIIDHMVWSTSNEKNKEVYTAVTNKIYESFPQVPVYPAIGNHEPHPLNMFSPDYVPEEVNTRWLYEYLYDIWSKYLPADTKETILKGGYYTVLVKPGFRIVTLNNNDCYTSNWWLYHNGSDMKTQLMWLHDVLLAAEKSNEYVHILAHIPSGDGTCWNVWSREYNRIIARFHKTISGIFNGHTHKDEMNVHYDENGYAIALSHNGGALTTYTFKNPNYRIYQVEPESLQVVDHETWIFNLTEANLAGEAKSPNWVREYTFAEEFTKDFSPAGVDKLLDEMADNPDLLRKFWRYKVTSADPALAKGCSRTCLLKAICRLATTVHDQTKRCEELKAKLSIALDKENSTTESTSQGTTVSTTSKPTDPEDNGDDGAISVSALSLTTLMSVILSLRYIM
ncbi:sphingomyelin phosphodiesterase 1-like [Lucilia sericata]|uniref:sphingomyelin phosphodiesterase 1-like n=1 Tax=Lucilia sericata TaxID=13632 RepID=UPI0018A82E47|nr:sphingomyelin phosphodiesterase 1-like [Lucilia sericata]